MEKEKNIIMVIYLLKVNFVKWNGKGYDYNNNIVYELKDGRGLIKEYFNDKLKFEGEYKNGKRNGKEKKIIGIMVI